MPAIELIEVYRACCNCIYLPKLSRFSIRKLLHYWYLTLTVWVQVNTGNCTSWSANLHRIYAYMYTSLQISLCITLVFILCLSKIWKSRTFLKSVEHLRLILFLTFNKSNLIQTSVHHISLNCVMDDSLICAIVNFFKLQPDFLKSNLRISARVNQAQDVVYIMW